MSLEEQILIRRRKVGALAVRGVSFTEMKKMLDIPPRTLLRDLKYCREVLKTRLKEEGVGDKAILDFIMANDEMPRETWSQYSEAETVKDRMLCMRMLSDIINSRIKLMQDVGYLERRIGTMDIKQFVVQWANIQEKTEDNRTGP